MNICLFFEGTGHGVAGRITNVTRLLPSNLWGAFDRVKRNLHRLRLHPACREL